MTITKMEITLKGQHNIAQGKRSVALGLKVDRKIVREVILIKEKILFRTREMTFCFPKMMICNSVRKKFYALFFEFPRTVFLLHLISRAKFRFVPPSTLPWAEIYWPFSPAKCTCLELCIKSSFLKIWVEHRRGDGVSQDFKSYDTTMFRFQNL